MISKYIKGKILVIIDAANLESSVKSLGWWIDYIKLRDLFDNKKLVEIRHYCVHHKTDNQNRFFTFLKKNRYKLITKPLKIIHPNDIAVSDIRKANFDVEIAIDVIEMIKQFDTLVLFSGDSDFHYLVVKLQEKNKKVIIVSYRDHISRELAKSSDKYISLDKLEEYIKRDK